MSEGLQKLAQSELDEIIQKHLKFISGIRGGARAVMKFKDLSHLNFRKADLSQSDFTGSILIGADMSGGNFRGVSFFSCDLRNANLEKACFARADMRGATVSGANLHGADFQMADLREGVVLERVAPGAGGKPGTPLNYFGEGRKAKTVFSGAKLSETNLSGARARDADFSDADLTGVIVKDADFAGANFAGANLTGADFTGSSLENTNLEASIMSGCILDAVETKGANLDLALREEDMGTRLETTGKTMAEMLDEHTAWIASAGAAGHRLDLSGFDLRHVLDIKKYPLTALKAVGANFLGQDLQGMHFQSADLSRADLRDIKAGKTDFRGSTMKNAMLARANLVGANFSPLVFPNPDGSKRLQRVNLTGGNLRYAILTGANLADAVLAGVDLSYAVLHDCDLRRADLTGAILDNADFHGAQLQDVISDRPIG